MTVYETKDGWMADESQGGIKGTDAGILTLIYCHADCSLLPCLL